MITQTPLGLNYPIQAAKSGYFDQTFDINQVAKVNLRNLLMTRKGERPLNPEFGTGLHGLIFDHNTEELGELVKQIIISSTEKYLPYITITEVDVNRSNENIDSNRIEASITFTVDSQSFKEQTLTIII